MLNRLANSTSPYLLQHQHNPVDWFPWGDEALRKAKEEDKPIFLSIGYSACHWCHVMEHESFENLPIANILNAHFVSIKVDREQRPDLDQIYMQVVQMLTGSGGWPMSVFLTPETKPFYGGTYWPPENRWGRPGFTNVLNSVAEAWKTKRQAILDQSEEIVGHLHQTIGVASANSIVESDPETTNSILNGAEQVLQEMFDPNHGGFGRAPKFPHASDLKFLMRRQAHAPESSRSHIIEKTLDCMASGGIYDHLGGGFARYSVDDRWLVPHFEKMLYDNALLVSAYLDGYRMTRKPEYATVVRETLDYLLREMTDPLGGFYSSEDADSEGEEGKFYVWSESEIDGLLGTDDGRLFDEVYGVTRSGNFEGHNILHLPRPIRELSSRFEMPELELRKRLAELRHKLLEARATRIRPLRDDKVLVSWNALMISAMVEAGVMLEDEIYLEAARRSAKFLLLNMRDADGSLLHVWRAGRAEIGAFLDDYAYLSVALIDLFEGTGESEWLCSAMALVEEMILKFSDEVNSGGFFFTAKNAEPLITRVKDLQDGSVPSGNSMAALALLRLSRWMDNDRYRRLSETTLQSAIKLLQQSPMAGGQWLVVLDEAFGDDETWVILMRESTATPQSLRTKIRLHRRAETKMLIVTVDEHGLPTSDTHPAIRWWLENRELDATSDGILYYCQRTVCQAPIKGIDKIVERITT